jgi:hypothetical protein
MNFSERPADSQSPDPHNLIAEFLEIVDRCMESAEHNLASNHVEENEERKSKELSGNK